MAGGDVQIAIPNGEAPTARTVTGQTAMVPKSVNASFDGSGAGGAFRPCLVITGREGFEVARIPADVVAAGASAEVSWFPRVAAAVAAGSGFDWCIAASASAGTIAPGPSNAWYFDLETNDPTAFSLTGGGFPRIAFNKTGTYLIVFAFDAISHPGSPIANPWTKVLQGGPGNFPGNAYFGPESFSDASGSASQHWDKTWTVVRQVDAGTVGSTLDWNWNNLTGATLASAYGGVVVIRLAD